MHIMGTHGHLWALMGRALMGPPGPLWAGPVGPALVGPPGPLWAWPLWAPMGPCELGPYGPGPCGPRGPSRAPVPAIDPTGFGGKTLE